MAPEINIYVVNIIVIIFKWSTQNPLSVVTWGVGARAWSWSVWSPVVVRRRRPSPVGPAAVVIVTLFIAIISSFITTIVIITASAHARPSTVCGSTHINSRSRCVWPLCNWVIDSDSAAIQLHSICTLFSLFGIFSVLKVNKGKAPGASRLLIIHNADITQRAILGKDLPEVPLCGVQAQPEHSQAAVWVWVCPVTNMTSTAWHRRVTVTVAATVFAAVGATARTSSAWVRAGAGTAIMSTGTPVRSRSSLGPGARAGLGAGVMWTLFGASRRAIWWATCRFTRSSRTSAPRGRTGLLNQPHSDQVRAKDYGHIDNV